MSSSPNKASNPKIGSQSSTKTSTPPLQTENYRFLGLNLNIELNWTKQIEIDEATVKRITTNLHDSIATPFQCTRIFEQVVIPTIAYKSAIIEYPRSALDKFSNIFKSVITRKLGISKWTPQEKINNKYVFPYNFKALHEVSLARSILLTNQILTSPNEKLNLHNVLPNRWTLNNLKFALKKTNLLPNSSDILNKILNNSTVFPKNHLKYSHRLQSPLIFTDGSIRTKEKNKAIAGIWANKNLHLCVELPTINDNYGAEVAAALIAVKTAESNTPNLTIVIDCKGVVSKINKLTKTKDSYILKWDYGFLFLEMKKVSTVKGIKLLAFHIPSHTLDGAYQAKKTALKQLRNKLGGELPLFIIGNQQVDQLCSNSPTPPNTPLDFSPTANNYLLVNDQEKDSNIKSKRIMKAIKNHLHKKQTFPKIHPSMNQKNWEKIQKLAIKENLDGFLFKATNNKLFDKKEEISKTQNQVNRIKKRIVETLELVQKPDSNLEYHEKQLEILETKLSKCEKAWSNLKPERKNPLCTKCNIEYSPNHYITCSANQKPWKEAIEEINEYIKTHKIRYIIDPQHYLDIIKENNLSALGSLPTSLTATLKRINTISAKTKKNLVSNISLELLKIARRMYLNTLAANTGKKEMKWNPSSTKYSLLWRDPIDAKNKENLKNGKKS